MLEDTTGIFKPEAKTIAKIFGDADSFYQIPDYQRLYSWGDEQIEQLWDDLYSAMESGDKSYFLGPVILIKIKKENEDWFEVVDGQQRLTTLTILFCVIRDLYREELGKSDKSIINRIQNAIISKVDEKPRLKLITQLHHQSKFENEILKGVQFPSKELTKKEREQEKFINAALIFKQKLEELKNKKNGGVEAVKKFAEFLLNNVEMITITCSQPGYAIRLFQVLNTRGLDLSPADLIKSHLYGKIQDKQRRLQFIATWQDVETLSKQMDESINDLFTYYEYYLLAQNPKRSLYEELIDKFKNKDPNDIIYDFKKFIDFFNEIYQMESKLIFSFWYLPNQVFWKAILTTAKKEGFNEFEELCRELRKMYYCYWVAGYTTSKIKQLSFNLIGWLKEGKKLDYIVNEIENKMRDDNVISRMKDNLQNDVSEERWLRPLLVLVEYAQTDDSQISYIELDNRLHVDHILPQEWESVQEWKKEKWTKPQAEKWLNKIGNLTLLSGRKNIAQQNGPPDKKKEMYEKGHGGRTAFEISRMVIRTLETGWTERDVEERQEWMIEQIESVLGVKFEEDTPQPPNIA